MTGVTELLVLKVGGDYLRVREGNAQRCGLEKASVFPLSRLEAVRAHLAELLAGGFPEARLCRLKITEEPFDCV